MNTNKLKSYAPKARLAFMEAVTKRAAFLGLYADRIAEMTMDGDSAVIEGRVFTRKQGQQRSQLVQRIEALGTTNGKLVLKDGFNQFINETAFTWFNRLTAIRYMEVNEYLDHGYRVLSNGENAKFGEGFEILGSAADVADDLDLNKESIIDMVLDGNKEEELYRTILLGQCHQLSEAMSFMFEKLDDATELLLPDNLTKTDSILKDLVNDIPEDNWQEIEVIGWLYQFYISEHKDAVIGKVVKRDDIPAATQLFTPNWIVKYLVQNSLGRQWLATYPDSELKEKMEYYITPAEQSDDVIEQLKAITPTSIEPEKIKVLDPACGSGHILVEVYEVLREIYLERGYRPREIPELILTKNIYGLDIDDRAAQMAAFAVLMKAREDDKRIFSRDIKLNIHSIQSTENLNINQLWAELDFDGNNQAGSMDDLFAEPQLELVEVSSENKVYLDLLRYLKEQFIDAKNLGSLIEVDSQHLELLTELKAKLADKVQGSEPTTKEAAQALLPIVEQATILARQYDVVVANPPYMGSKYQTPLVKKYLKDNFKGYEKDLFSAFIIRNLQLTREHGELGFMTPFVWMFISSYEQLRLLLLDKYSITSLVQLEYGGFDGATVAVCCFSINKTQGKKYIGSYIRLSDFKGAKNQAPKTLEAINDKSCGWFFETPQNNLTSIPGYPIAYWTTSSIINSFNLKKNMKDISHSFQGMITGNNDYFLRSWHEINNTSINYNALSYTDVESMQCWIPYSKGGGFRKWFGNNEHIVRWNGFGNDMVRGRTENRQFFFREGLTWSDISSSLSSFRLQPKSILFDAKGPTAIYKNNMHIACIGLMNSVFAQKIIELLNPSVSFQLDDFNKIPINDKIFNNQDLIDSVNHCINISKADWDSLETSWGFTTLECIKTHSSQLQTIYNESILNNQLIINKIMDFEININKLIADTYKFSFDENEFRKNNQISLISNSSFYFGTKISSHERNIRQQSIFITRIISFYIGCTMGRYSLDREGLVYAHSGNNGFKELVAEGAYKTFPADDDGIVPLADEDWVFEDDATTRFREFVKTVWGEEHLSENLDFVAESLCLDAIKPKKGESSMDTIRRYFSTQFFKDHLKTYKKRPIYWLFSSGKEKAFECLVYLHRYNEGTLSRMRTEYVTPLMGKLESRKNILNDSKAAASGAELRTIDKELKTIDKKQAELVKFDEELKHLAEMKITLDLDDGVKVNYGKFGNLLSDVKAIHGQAPEKIK
ncbi:BREX-1 system adenine-specific DNA-methyltransferase PglX [Aliivibrio finisterrensis]|uniref:site-specific DNA-methyltransferase (adenine-specific) n=1 Tax=Aliivibrio finisterrensis TaxID=511998 RepID=A0A4Q5KMR2_9GAMM|nr:BREX-1 system adenine-specific DNA-methyltransferase PglX [Aliivibrio finisterrensis]RYU47764.1 BREX-1 system adenine-specific DNA-methyltransferase PglX [Aliivibrio finisterrensis]RYU48361.1 BREX-1 system adenine-specific DNA-methyltransferase PglX [Aliivibrio finisterrensis]RYU53538.1 BREX-1 system adenine-specific DNA-methyltransferase PglX [Aliivibrio finisterrensis]RYU78999.1 BREX-1 system adenine-specific DNA-methyltransferase PglX [Aliivibrio finisterrensis]